MICRMSTEQGAILVSTEDIRQLEVAMRFKAGNIKAKADPEIFAAVANVLGIFGMMFSPETIAELVRELYE